MKKFLLTLLLPAILFVSCNREIVPGGDSQAFSEEHPVYSLEIDGQPSIATKSGVDYEYELDIVKNPEDEKTVILKRNGKNYAEEEGPWTLRITTEKGKYYDVTISGPEFTMAVNGTGTGYRDIEVAAMIGNVSTSDPVATKTVRTTVTQPSNLSLTFSGPSYLKYGSTGTLSATLKSGSTVINTSANPDPAYTHDGMHFFHFEITGNSVERGAKYDQIKGKSLGTSSISCTCTDLSNAPLKSIDVVGYQSAVLTLSIDDHEASLSLEDIGGDSDLFIVGFGNVNVRVQGNVRYSNTVAAGEFADGESVLLNHGWTKSGSTYRYSSSQNVDFTLTTGLKTITSSLMDTDDSWYMGTAYSNGCYTPKNTAYGGTIGPDIELGQMTFTVSGSVDGNLHWEDIVDYGGVVLDTNLSVDDEWWVGPF